MLAPKPRALPRPEQAIVQGLFNLPIDARRLLLKKLLVDYEVRSLDVGILEKKIEFVMTSLCGSDDKQHVEDYDGNLGVSVDFVRNHEQPIGMLRWRKLDGSFEDQGESPGTVSGKPWGTGALIGGNLLLTAGHCFDQTGHAYIRPKRNDQTLAPHDLALLMEVVFNYQKEKGQNKPRPVFPFPVIRLLEYRWGELDYAIVQLGANDAGEMPSDRFGTLRVASQDVTEGDRLCIIQHPDGEPKQIEAGEVLLNEYGSIAYNDIDTIGGASGAPILHPVADDAGEIVGIHTHGGCTTLDGANGGVAIGAIREVSDIL